MYIYIFLAILIDSQFGIKKFIRIIHIIITILLYKKKLELTIKNPKKQNYLKYRYNVLII